MICLAKAGYVLLFDPVAEAMGNSKYKKYALLQYASLKERQTTPTLQPTQKVLHLKIQIPLHEIYNDNPELIFKT